MAWRMAVGRCCSLVVLYLPIVHTSVAERMIHLRSSFYASEEGEWSLGVDLYLSEETHPWWTLRDSGGWAQVSMEVTMRRWLGGDDFSMVLTHSEDGFLQQPRSNAPAHQSLSPRSSEPSHLPFASIVAELPLKNQGSKQLLDDTPLTEIVDPQDDRDVQERWLRPSKGDCLMSKKLVVVSHGEQKGQVENREEICHVVA
ncbi:hypothetical protein BKA70DRAFT_1241434 [Coprinopsis sp. MPI-PUGE-AT-0042]|nr:hypothetical protein BKA70DRAFT_1241434 [Coprinopsis sp. MPI-PUGE-AT-0042]